MKRVAIRQLLLTLPIFYGASSSPAAIVTGSAPYTVVPRAGTGAAAAFSLSVNDAGTLHALGGVIHYDAARLGEPSLAAGGGAIAAATTALRTHLRKPGELAFLMYQDPPGAGGFNLAAPVLNLSFAALPGAPAGPAGISFAESAAGRWEPSTNKAISLRPGDPDGNPAAGLVRFDPFIVEISRSMFLASPNEEASGNFGIAIAGTADVTGDAKGDVIVGAYLEDPGASPEGAGRTHLFDGTTGAPWTTLASPSEAVDGNFGRNVQGIADLNADGRNEILVGSWQEQSAGGPAGSGRVHVYNGATGALIRSINSPNPQAGGRFGARVSGGGDVSNDGKQDIFVGAPYEDAGAAPLDMGRAYIFSGANGALLRTLTSPEPKANGLFGFFIAGFYDLTGDFRGDLVVGAHQEEAAGKPSDSGLAHAFNGVTGALLYTLQSPTPCTNGWFGRNLARLFDITGDGRLDIVVGAPQENTGSQPARAGRVHLYNGATGAFIRSITSPNGVPDGRFGWSVQSLPDVNGDGKGEILIGAPEETVGGNAKAGRAYLFSGAGGLLDTLESPLGETSGLFGVTVHGVQDNTGDGKWEIAVGARQEDPGASPDNSGRVYVFSSPTY